VPQLVILAGIIAAVVIHEGAHFVAAKTFGMQATQAFFGFGPTLWSTRRGETEYGIKLLPLGGFVRITGMNLAETVDPAIEHRTYRGKPFSQKFMVVLAGILANLLLAFLLLYAVVVGFGIRDPSRPLVGEVVATLEDGTPTPASQADIQQGDRVLAIDGVAVKSWEQVIDHVSARAGQPITFLLGRQDREIEVVVTPASIPSGDTVSGFVGLGGDFEVDRPDPIAGVVRAGEVFADQVGATVIGFGRFLWPPNLVGTFGDAISGREIDLEQRPSTPIGIVRIGSRIQERFGWEGLLAVLSSFNLVVALFNVLPFYPLDGGHAAVAIYERVKGRPVNPDRLLPVAAMVVSLFVLIFLLGLFLDITRPFDL